MSPRVVYLYVLLTVRVVDRVLCILLDVAKDADIQLKVSYVVSMAMWSPKYDLRVFSKDGKMKVS